jgi:UDP-glucose 4-epimerase
MPYQMVDRAPGDMATYYTDPTYAAEIPNWKAESELDEIYELAKYEP